MTRLFKRPAASLAACVAYSVAAAGSLLLLATQMTTHPEPAVWYVVGDLECSERLGAERTWRGALLHCQPR